MTTSIGILTLLLTSLPYGTGWRSDTPTMAGHPYDPVVFFKFQLIMFFEGIRSERQLVETASLNVAHRWYLGYHFDESLPDRSSLIKIRQRLGLAIFRRFFEHVVDLCEAAGLIWGRDLIADATRVPGNASMDSLVPRLSAVVDDYLEHLFAAGPTAGESDPDHDRWDLLETCRLDPQRPPSGPYHRISDRKVSRTDPDACAMSMRDGRTVLGYQDHYLVDGGKARIILHAFATPGDVAETNVLVDQVRRTIFRRKRRPKRVIADAKYASASNIGALETAGIQAYVPLPEWDKSSTRFKHIDFTYDSELNVYRCPQGEELVPRWFDPKWEQWVYRARASTCNACAVKAECTTSSQGRLLRRSIHAESLERVQRRQDTLLFKKAMRKRRIWAEGLFAEAKQWHGLHRFRVCGLTAVNVQALLVASGQNLKRWLRTTDWGRRGFPGLAVEALSPLWSSERRS
jgi:transposase